MSTALAKTSSIRDIVSGDKFREQVSLALPQHLTPERFTRIALTQFTKNPKLLECTQESVLRCLMDSAAIGLEPDGRNAHLIPYKDTCTFILDWKGMVALARRSGDVAVWKAELVCERDAFSWENGTVSHKVNWREDRGKLDAVYSYVKFKDGSEDYEVMTIAEVKAIQARSKAGNSGPWVTDFNEMAKKTVMRRHSKRLTLSPEFAAALDKDDDRFDRIERNVTPRGVAVPSLGLSDGKKKESASDKFWAWCDKHQLSFDAVEKYLADNKLTAETATPDDMDDMLDKLGE